MCRLCHRFPQDIGGRMVDVRPFRGVRYNPERFGKDLSSLICPPYDVISPAAQLTLIGRSPKNMIRLELPTSPDPVEGEVGTDRYRAAADRYVSWLGEG